jgi:4-azaleucine resistance transporter AzlC
MKPVSQTPLGGAREALPIVFGYVPIGIAYGVLGVSAGVPGWAVVAMSVIVYAGSAQFIAVSLLGSGATAATIIATTFLVNLRHILYSSALSPRLRRMGRGRLAWLAAELTDESFVVISQVVRRTGARGTGPAGGLLPFGFVAGLQGTAQLAWVAGSAIGVVAAGLIGDPARLGLDYALVAMFLGLLALQLHGRREVAVAVTGGGVALILRLLGMGTSAVIPATLLASAVGLLFVTKARPRRAVPGNEETE